MTIYSSKKKRCRQTVRQESWRGATTDKYGRLSWLKELPVCVACMWSENDESRKESRNSWYHKNKRKGTRNQKRELGKYEHPPYTFSGTLSLGLRKRAAGWKKKIRRKQLKVLLCLHKNKPSEQDWLNIIRTKRTSPPYAGCVEKAKKQLPYLVCESKYLAQTHYRKWCLD